MCILFNQLFVDNIVSSTKWAARNFSLPIVSVCQIAISFTFIFCPIDSNKNLLRPFPCSLRWRNSFATKKISDLYQDISNKGFAYVCACLKMWSDSLISADVGRNNVITKSRSVSRANFPPLYASLVLNLVRISEPYVSYQYILSIIWYTQELSSSCIIQ